MKFLVCLKQVPDSTVRVKVAADGKSVATDGITWSISPYDEYAIELALEHKDSDPSTTVSVVTVGPARSRDALRQALAMGCDDATLVTSDEKVSGLDVAKALAAGGDGIELWREIEGGHEVWSAPLPVVGMVHKSAKEPRYPSLPGIMKAKKKEIPEKDLAALGVTPGAPRAEVTVMEPPPQRGGGKILKADGDVKALAVELARLLHEEAKVL